MTDVQRAAADAEIARIGTVADRQWLGNHDGRSGARLERVRLVDGSRLVVKYSDPAEDVTVALTGGVQREHELWAAGVLDRLPVGLGHPLLAVAEAGGVAITVMRDLGEDVVGWERILTAAETLQVLDALTGLHATFLGGPPAGALGLAARVGLLSPYVFRDRAPGHPLAPAVTGGWERFVERVDPAVAAAVDRLHRDPAPLVEALSRGPQTLLHADLWPVNLALVGDEVVLLDWAVATAGPPVLDLAVFLTGSAANLALTREQVIAAFCERSPTTDRSAVDLALLFGLVEMAWNMALDAAEHEDPAVRARQAADLAWWVDRAAPGLALLG